MLRSCMDSWVFQSQNRELVASAGANGMGRNSADRLSAAEPRHAAPGADSPLQAAYFSPPPTLFLAGLRAILSLAERSPASASVDQLVLRRVSPQLSAVIRVLGWHVRPGLFFAGPVR